MKALLLALTLAVGSFTAQAQVAPSATEAAAYTGLHAAAHKGDVSKVQRLIASGAALNATDAHLDQGDLRFEPASALTDHDDGLRHQQT